MNDLVYGISLLDLAWIFIPVSVVVAIFLHWSMGVGPFLHGFARMFAQLLLVGYVLTYIFAADQPVIILGILCVMLAAAGLIAMRPLKHRRRSHYLKAVLAIFIGGVSTLVIATQGVIGLDPWYEPRYLIPIAGMIFASSMNAVSLGAERFEAETEGGKDYPAARATALRAALIPITNTLFAVGVVSLPGMMTGQILSGVSPLVAARYQIMVMCMIFGSAGISAALYLFFIKEERP